MYSCNLSNVSVPINLCTDENCGSDDRPKEGSTTISVCTDIESTDIRYCVFDNVDPEVGGLQWIVDIVTGQVSLCKRIPKYHHIHIGLLQSNCSLLWTIF